MVTPRFRPRPPPATILKIINELNTLQHNCNCSLDQLQKALDHLKAINEKLEIERK